MTLFTSVFRVIGVQLSGADGDAPLFLGLGLMTEKLIAKDVPWVKETGNAYH